MLKRLEVFLVIALFLLITAIILIVYTKQREYEFLAHQDVLQTSSVRGASHAVTLYLLDEQRNTRLLVDEYAPMFMQVLSTPGDFRLIEEVKNRLQKRFPGFLSFTFADHFGQPTVLDIDGIVGELCQRDLQQYAGTIKEPASRNNIYIHPQPGYYHYDIMVPLSANGGPSRIFFISFLPDGIAEILGTHEIPGYQLMLVKQDDPRLIEISSEGVRDKIEREIRLSDDEFKRVKVGENLPDTHWRLVSLPVKNFQEHYLKGLWREAVIIILLVMLCLLLIMPVLFKLARSRKADEQ
jgi:hypothetical protein